MSMYTDSPGQAHGGTSPARVDPSTMLALIVGVALVVIGGLHFAFSTSVSR